MRFIKIVSLVSALTMVTLALAGASPAMAEDTALCTVNEDPCLPENQLKTLHLATNFQVMTFDPIYNFTHLCLDMLIEAEVLEPGSPQLLQTTGMEVHGCGWHGTHSECQFEVLQSKLVGLPAFALLREGENLGTLTAESGRAVYKCSNPGLMCSYEFKGMELQMEGAEHLGASSGNGMITAEGDPLTLTEGSYLCELYPGVNFLLESLTDFYITSPPPPEEEL